MNRMYFNMRIKIISMKKVIFWIDANLSTFCIAKKIKDDIECEMHGIFNVTNKPKKFIQNQKLIDWITEKMNTQEDYGQSLYKTT